MFRKFNIAVLYTDYTAAQMYVEAQADIMDAPIVWDKMHDVDIVFGGAIFRYNLIRCSSPANAQRAMCGHLFLRVEVANNNIPASCISYAHTRIRKH